MKKGFTLIELLAVIILLAVIALIATPIVLNVVGSAKEKAYEASIQGYGEALKLAVYDYQFANNGNTPDIDQEWVDENVKKSGNEVVCKEYYYSKEYGIVLHECRVSGSDELFYLANQKVYKDPNDPEYKAIYEAVNVKHLTDLLLEQYDENNTTGLLKDETGYYYKGTNDEVSNNFVWFEGHLWRVISINNDNTLTMITQQVLTKIHPGQTWKTKKEYETSYVNEWLNDVFLDSISDKSKLQKTIFNIGIYNDVSEITIEQYVGLLDYNQYEKAGNFLKPDVGYWGGNRADSTDIKYFGTTFVQLEQGNPSHTWGVRPVIRVKNLDILVGDGSLSNPYRGKNVSTDTTNIKVGEYISVPVEGDYCSVTAGRCLFRVISKDDDSIKVILNGVLPEKSKFNSISENLAYSEDMEIYIPLTNFVNSISDKYRYENNKVFYTGIHKNSNSDYSGSSYLDVRRATYEGNVGLPVFGEMFSGRDIASATVNIATIENSDMTQSFWLMNAYYDASRMWSSSGVASATQSLGVRPTLFLKRGLTFASGEGTAENPYILN